MEECDRRIAELEKEIEDKAGPEYKKFKDDLMQKRVNKATVEDKQEQLSDTNEELQQNIELDREELADVEKDIATLTNTINENKIALDEKKAEKAKVDAEVKRINEELSSKGGEHKQLQDKLTVLEPKIDAESVRSSELSKDLAALDAKRGEVSRTLAEAETFREMVVSHAFVKMRRDQLFHSRKSRRQLFCHCVNIQLFCEQLFVFSDDVFGIVLRFRFSDVGNENHGLSVVNADVSLIRQIRNRIHVALIGQFTGFV